MKDCLFCKISKKEIPAEVVYEDDAVLGFLDIQPRAMGHTVIIPKNHADNIQKLSDEDTARIFQVVKKLTFALNKTFSPEGFTIGINHFNEGSVNPLHVNHFHVHIIPRFGNDGGEPIQGVVDNPPKESLRETRSKIISNMN